MSLSATAIITLQEWAQYAKKDTSNQNIPVAQVELIIDGVSEHIVNYLQRKVVYDADTEVTVTFFGDGTRAYVVPDRRVNSVVSVSYWSGTAWTELGVATYPYTSVQDTGEVYFTQGHKFAKDTEYQVVYKTGWIQASVPVDIKLAALSLVERTLKTADGRDGLRSEAAGGATTSYDLATLMTPRVQALLAPYRSF